MPRVDVNNYPAIKEHLDQYYEKLEKRDDQGDTPYNLRSCAYMDDFSKQKIVWADIATEPSFVYIKNEIYFNNTCYMISNAPLFLTAILNSKLIKWYFPKIAVDLGTSGARYFKQFVENIPVPQMDNCTDTAELLTIEASKCNKNEEVINKLIYKLYKLTDDEIRFIDNST